MYGALNAFHAVAPFAPFPDKTCTTKSVALKVRPTPVQGLQVEEVLVPETSKEGVAPAGGKNSMKFPPQNPGAPEMVTVMVLAPPVPERL